MASGWFTSSPVLGQQAGSGLALPNHFAHFASDEHVALLGNPEGFDRLLRKDDLLDEGVAAVFGHGDAEAELLALCFHARKFTSAQAAQWLAGRGIAPLIFVPDSGRDRLRCPTRRS